MVTVDVPAPQLVDQLEHRLVDVAAQRPAERRVLGAGHEVAGLAR